MDPSPEATVGHIPVAEESIRMSASEGQQAEEPAEEAEELSRAESSVEAFRGAEKWVYHFGGGATEGSGSSKDLLGGKGANLAEMAILGLPVPPGFTITTDVCAHFVEHGRTYPLGLAAQVGEALAKMGEVMQSKFGSVDKPLLVSVRSGARVTMPGMMDTVLNLGLNDAIVESLSRLHGERFALDCYRRFIHMYAVVVLGIEASVFKDLSEVIMKQRPAVNKLEVSLEALREMKASFKRAVAEHGSSLPEDPIEQLWAAIGAVFGSWMNPRAKTWRRRHGIPASWGTAVNVQAMVYGNMGEDCATGVAFTRDPSTGAKEVFGEFLINAQGTDVLAGTHAPHALTLSEREAQGTELPSLQEAMPDAFSELLGARQRLESHFGEMQDIEFTVERSKLYVLQTRTGKRTVQAALKVAADMVKEGLISEDEAVGRIKPLGLGALLQPTLDPSAYRRVIARGLPVSPGAASGKVALATSEVVAFSQRGEAAILVREEIGPQDIDALCAAHAVVTSRGGMASNAAVVARSMGLPCVAGVRAMRVDLNKGLLAVNEVAVRSGEVVTVDGSTGEVVLGEVAKMLPSVLGDFATILGWADTSRRMRVSASADTAEDAATGLRLGAEEVGLVKTTQLFLTPDRLQATQEMVLAETGAQRQAALNKLLPAQRSDLAALFRVAAGKHIRICLLDAPLHELLEQAEERVHEAARAVGLPFETLRERAKKWLESSPTKALRGCRLFITRPEICEMQARAILEAASKAAETGDKPRLEIMVPMVATAKELEAVKKVIHRTAQCVMDEHGGQVSYSIGAVISLPCAALQAGALAAEVESLALDSEGLTQRALGLSMTDADAFARSLQAEGVLDQDPFLTLDQKGVGELIQIAAERSRRKRPQVVLGLCGMHGSDPESIAFCERVGLDYISCSPLRVPSARLAAAQAHLRERKRQRLT